MTSHAGQRDVTKFYKLVLIDSNHVVLATFGVRYDSHFALYVCYKKFTKLLMDPRRWPLVVLKLQRGLTFRLGLHISFPLIHENCKSLLK